MFTYPKRPKCRSEAKRSDVPYGHASILHWQRERSDRAIQEICGRLQISQVPHPFYYIEKTIFSLKKH